VEKREAKKLILKKETNRMGCLARTLTIVVILGGALGGSASAQSLNVNFGPAGTAPSPTYAAAGLPGVWNNIEGTEGHPYWLVGLDGNPTNVELNQIGAWGLLSAFDPSVSGDDAALLDHALVTYAPPGDEVCLIIDGLEPGRYEVIIYAWMPNAPTVLSRVRQDLSMTTYDVGGAWPGGHVEGITYARHVLDLTGYLGSHSGVPKNGLPENGAALNGFQLHKL